MSPMLAPLASQNDERGPAATEIFTPQYHGGSVPRENFHFEGLNNICDSFFMGKPVNSSPSSMDVDENDYSSGDISAVASEV